MTKTGMEALNARGKRKKVSERRKGKGNQALTTFSSKMPAGEKRVSVRWKKLPQTRERQRGGAAVGGGGSICRPPRVSFERKVILWKLSKEGIVYQFIGGRKARKKRIKSFPLCPLKI